MKPGFQAAFRSILLVFALLLAWSVWAAAQPEATKTVVVVSTNQPSVLERKLEAWQESPLTFGLDRLPVLREHSVLGEPLWKYTASLLYVLLAFYASKLLDFITALWLRRISRRTATTRALLLELLHGPIKVVVFVVLLNIGLGVFDWSERVKLYISKALILVVGVALTYVALKIMDVLLDAWRRRHGQGEKFDTQLFSVLRISLNTFLLIIAVLVTAQNLNINITAAIASLSIGGLAVGLAAQDTLANLFGAVAVFVDKPFRVDDQIKLDGAEGTVETVGLRSTRVRSPEGNLVAVPNKTMGNAIITNRSRRPGIKTELNLVLPQDVPLPKIKRAIALLEEIYRHHPKTEQALVSFNQFAGSKINLLVVHWWKGTDYAEYLAGLQEMNLEVKERFEKEGIPLA